METSEAGPGPTVRRRWMHHRCSILVSPILGAMVSFGLLWFCQPIWAHPDLLIQIERLSRQLDESPADTELLIKRGDLYRRHGYWLAGEADFEAVRKIEPQYPNLDWYQGRLLVDARRSEEGDVFLTRFLEAQPQHSGAYRVRAQARWDRGLPLLAARDFQSAIEYSERPSPALFRSLTVSLAVAGPEQMDAAYRVAMRGLNRFPGEVNLMGLATDLALSKPDPLQTRMLLADVPSELAGLPQWKFRQAVLACIEGDATVAAADFSELLMAEAADSGPRAGTWELPQQAIQRLAGQPRIEDCRSVTWDMLQRQQP